MQITGMPAVKRIDVSVEAQVRMTVLHQPDTICGRNIHALAPDTRAASLQEAHIRQIHGFLENIKKIPR